MPDWTGGQDLPLQFPTSKLQLPFIQERDIGSPLTDKPCVAEVCWYGETDDGLVDMRTEVELWGLESEIARWHEIRNMDGNQNLTNT